MNATLERSAGGHNVTGQLAMRGRYQGMLQILKFNRRFYGLTAMAVIALVMFAALGRASYALRNGAVAAAALAIYWGCASLLVSHWVYDLSPVYRWAWIAKIFETPPRRWANIHAGLDESTAALKALFPGSNGVALDIFNAEAMTERSIAAARKAVIESEPAAVADFRALPFANGTLDAVFLIFAAHELRKPHDRETFFREINRVVRRDGLVVLVEHMRDWRNFAAFGPGFMHFLPRSAWHAGTRAAGLHVVREFSMTPFVRIFVIGRPQ